MIGPQRFSSVPWLRTDLDLEEGRRFLWEIDYHHDADKATCMAVADPFQHVPQLFLVMHASRGNGNDGGYIALAISESPQYDVYAKESFALARRTSPQADGDGG